MTVKDENGNWIETLSTKEKTGLWVTQWSVITGKMTGSKFVLSSATMNTDMQ